MKMGKKYYYSGYDTKERFASYWHQIDEILRCAPQSVLDIGIGNNFIADYLKKQGVAVTTLDKDEALNPDILSVLPRIPLPDLSVDVISACQTLEHIDYEDFLKTLQEFWRVTRKYVVISLPESIHRYAIKVQLPFFGALKILIPVYFFISPRLDPQHCWQLDYKVYTVKKVSADIKKAGFVIKKNFIVFENPGHRFFVLEKKV